MQAGMEVLFGDMALQLLAAKAVYWPAQQTLFVADLHFGKGTAMRRSGVPVPSGSTTETLLRLTRLVETCEAKRLIVLGDLFHARGSLSPVVCEQMGTFLQSLASCSVALVIGNHDRSAGKLPSEWPIELVQPGTIFAGVTLFHEPESPVDDSELALCGHIHPSVQVSNRRETLGKRPCFWYHQRCLVLPAFGSFTGTHCVKAKPSDQIWAILDDTVIALGRKRPQPTDQ